MNIYWEEIGKSIISFLFSALKVILPGYAAAWVINTFVTWSRGKACKKEEDYKINGFYYISWLWAIKALIVFYAIFLGLIWYMAVKDGIECIIETGTIDTENESVLDLITWTLFIVPLAVVFWEGMEYVLWQLKFDDETIYYRNRFGITRKYRFSDVDFVSHFSPGVVGNDYDVVYGKRQKTVQDLRHGVWRRVGFFFSAQKTERSVLRRRRKSLPGDHVLTQKYHARYGSDQNHGMARL